MFFFSRLPTRGVLCAVVNHRPRVINAVLPPRFFFKSVSSLLTASQHLSRLCSTTTHQKSKTTSTRGSICAADVTAPFLCLIYECSVKERYY